MQITDQNRKVIGWRRNVISGDAIQQDSHSGVSGGGENVVVRKIWLISKGSSASPISASKLETSLERTM